MLRLTCKLSFLQTNVMYYKGIGHALATIARDEGLRGLYKGMGATLMVSQSRFGLLLELAYHFLLISKLWVRAALVEHSTTVETRGGKDS